ncbi:MAG: hypothetical protein A2015_10710 [Spirochaetes bacterium GWF1_31_7]|nr:MAG: hypothetical protein A2015_10710 [Spirochaetes bacterium GWF1_31_7]OHD74051.1 MAG: hypothetical protein A2355_08750 [Spirochaetes bacterium RIFOXYB1_FULL_32_8]HBD93514.1 hypothetical protein [Spirochaetia bacterium]HBI37047.1 hypothetical protein [Spirochaetia bacterium]
MKENEGINYQVYLDKEVIKNISTKVGLLGFNRFVEEIKKEVVNFIPRDTDTLINSSYIDQSIDGLTYVFGYGAPYNTHLPINKIAVYQHENSLNHYGLPGVSMRIGVAGASLPGKKHWQPGDNSDRGFDSTLKAQYNQYWQGYRAKKRAGQLSRYKSQFLKRALEVVSGMNIKDIIGDINIEIINNKLDDKLKLPKGVL